MKQLSFQQRPIFTMVFVVLTMVFIVQTTVFVVLTMIFIVSTMVFAVLTMVFDVEKMFSSHDTICSNGIGEPENGEFARTHFG